MSGTLTDAELVELVQNGEVIELVVSNVGTEVERIEHANVHAPPVEVSPDQWAHFGSVLAIFRADPMADRVKLVAVQKYATRWGLEIVRTPIEKVRQRSK